MKYRFIINKATGENFCFLLVDPQNYPLMKSPLYKTREECITRILQLRKNIVESNISISSKDEIKFVD